MLSDRINDIFVSVVEIAVSVASYEKNGCVRINSDDFVLDIANIPIVNIHIVGLNVCWCNWNLDFIVMNSHDEVSLFEASRQKCKILTLILF